MLDEMTQQSTSKFAIFFWNMKTRIVIFSFCATLFFCPNECPGICHHIPGQGIHNGKKIKYVAQNEK